MTAHIRLSRILIVALLPMLLMAGIALAQTPSAAPLAAGPDVADWRVGAPVLRETFASGSSWQTDSGRRRNRYVSLGVLTINASNANQLVWSEHEDSFGDFYLEVDTAHVDGPLDNMLGIAFRMQDAENFYMFAISSDGYYALGKYVGDTWRPLVDWTQSDVIAAGEGGENRLGLLAAGNDIVLLINNVEMGRVVDRSFDTGALALVVGAGGEGGPVVSFDNLWLWTESSSPAAKTIGAKPGRATPTPSRGTSPAGAGATVTSETLNVRSGPATAYPSVATLKKGDSVRIIGRSADSQWVKIDLAGQSQAWVAARFLDITIDLTSVAVAQAPAPPPTPKPQRNVAWLVIENHIGRHITIQVNDKNFQVDGKVGDKPGKYTFTLEGAGLYRVAAQLPNEGSHNWDLYVETDPKFCAGRNGCISLGETFVQTYY